MAPKRGTAIRQAALAWQCTTLNIPTGSTQDMKKTLEELGYTVDGVVYEFNNRDNAAPNLSGNKKKAKKPKKNSKKSAGKKRLAEAHVLQDASASSASTALTLAEASAGGATTATTGEGAAINADRGVSHTEFKAAIDNILSVVKSMKLAAASKSAVVPRPDTPQPFYQEVQSSGEESEPEEDEEMVGVTHESKFSNVFEYFIDTKTLNAVHNDKPVPLIKLLPGFTDSGKLLTIEGGALRMIDDSSSKKLEKQVMPLNQLLFALFKFKQLSRHNSAKAGDVARHIHNIIQISILYSGDIYFFYHGHVWSKFFGQAVKVWGGNWVDLDPLALNAATIRAGQVNQANHVNFCERCNSYTHATAVCPFTVREVNYGRVASNFSSVQGPGNGKPISRYTKGACRYFNSSGKCVVNACQFKHVCASCASSKHGSTNCTVGNNINFVNDY